jgi:hypothetical protein
MILWHGNVFRSLQTVDDITTDLEDEDTGGQQDPTVLRRTSPVSSRLRRASGRRLAAGPERGGRSVGGGSLHSATTAQVTLPVRNGDGALR